MIDGPPCRTRIGAVRFGDSADVQFDLNDYSTKQDVQHALRRIQYVGGRTNIADALRIARTQMFTAGTYNCVGDLMWCVWGTIKCKFNVHFNRARLGRRQRQKESGDVRTYVKTYLLLHSHCTRHTTAPT